MITNTIERFLVTGLWFLLGANIALAVVSLILGNSEGATYGGLGAAVAGACIIARAALR